ncbi:MAG: exodeoxyribonuclease V subunit gamma, partial [Balneolaceae bacterium]
MLHYYKSNSLKSLAESFSNVLESDSLNPLKAPWIVVQNNEIKEWLSLYYANQKGIAANFRFIFPSEFLWTLYRLHRKDIPQNLPGDLSAMHWALFQLFTDQPDKLQLIPSFSSEIEDPKKLFQFCAQLADVFDQYQVYRPEMIESWLKDEMKSRHKDEKWQAQIWKTLNDVWASNPEINNIPRRSEAFTHLLDLIENDKAYLNQLPEHLYVFGLSQASNPFLEIITSLSVNKQVHFFAGNENVVEVNEASKALFETWSKPKKQQQDLIQELIKRKDISYKPLQINASKNFIEVKIHSGHNKRREVETLKDSVLRFLDSNKNSRADDVLILVPDAEAYAGTLETTFSNNDGEPALPISGITKKSTQSASHALVQLLELFSTAFKATEVIQLMQLSPIREKFGFAETDIDLIEDWIIQNKIFFGLGDDFNAAYSWTKGLNQLLAGFAMEAEDWQVYNGLMPFGGISSSDQVQLAARFANFIHTLKAAAEKEIIPKKPQEWVSFTERLVQDFISDQHEVISQKSRLFQLLKKLKDQLSFSKASGEVSYELIKTWLINQIDSDSSSSGRFGQGITVSTYVPYRSVPYQFIAMLGMNESVFPRKSVRPTFDLIYADPKPGDRILKEDDTLLFLETLNAAQKHLHLSYEG